jgi:hypothetical protein
MRIIPQEGSVEDTEYSLRLVWLKPSQDRLGLPRKKERLTIKHTDEIAQDDLQLRQQRDPQELKIYIKQLSKALKFLPLGSRAYYAVTGELLRANTQLRVIVPAGSPLKGEH